MRTYRSGRSVGKRHQQIVHECIRAGVVRNADANASFARIDRYLAIRERGHEATFPRTQVLTADLPETRQRRVRPDLIRKLGLRQVKLQTHVSDLERRKIVGGVERRIVRLERNILLRRGERI